MKKIKIPAPQHFKPGARTEANAATYYQFLREKVWSHPQWREDEASFRAWERLTQKFAAAEAEKAAVVTVEDRDYERMRRLATLSDEQLNPAITQQLMVFVGAFLFAETVTDDAKAQDQSTVA